VSTGEPQATPTLGVINAGRNRNDQAATIRSRNDDHALKMSEPSASTISQGD
jgi:hypothetical protein